MIDVDPRRAHAEPDQRILLGGEVLLVGRAAGVPNEQRATVVLIFASGDEMVIHAMQARRQYWELLP